jgi:hypothetical protein
MTSEITGRQQALWSQTLQLENIEKISEGRIQQEIANNCPARNRDLYGAQSIYRLRAHTNGVFPLCFGALETPRVVKQALPRQLAKRNGPSFVASPRY